MDVRVILFKPIIFSPQNKKWAAYLILVGILLVCGILLLLKLAGFL
jgi:uncharacterized membrane protein YgdD (TMEM256/DUF423 family)